MSGYTSEELTALIRAIALFEDMTSALAEIGAYPDRIHLLSHDNSNYLGWIGYDDGTAVFTPDTTREGDK